MSFGIYHPYFEGMISQIYTAELQVYETNSVDIKDPTLDWDLSILNDKVSSNLYNK